MAPFIGGRTWAGAGGNFRCCMYKKRGFTLNVSCHLEFYNIGIVGPGY